MSERNGVVWVRVSPLPLGAVALVACSHRSDGRLVWVTSPMGQGRTWRCTTRIARVVAVGVFVEGGRAIARWPAIDAQRSE